MQHNKYSECFFLSNKLNPPKTSLTTLFEIHFTAVLQSKHIRREPWLCVSDYVQPSCIQVGWQKWAFIKEIVHFRMKKQKKEGFYIATEKYMNLTLGFNCFGSPFLKVPWWEPKNVPWFYKKHKDNKILPKNGDGNKFKKECHQSVTIKDLASKTVTIPDWNCEA